MNELCHTLLLTLARCSLQGGVMVGLVLAVQWLLHAELTPRWRNALWMLVLARLLLPVTLPSKTSLFNLLPAESVSATVNSAAAIPSPAASPTMRSPIVPETGDVMLSQKTFTVEWPVYVVGLWIAGMLYLTIRILVQSRRFSRQSRWCVPCVSSQVQSVYQECCRQMGLAHPPALKEMPGLGSPVVHGGWRARIILPVGFAEHFPSSELRFIFLHELAHVKRGDLRLNWLTAAVQCVHWFNPLVWFGFARWRDDRELASDALALRAAGFDHSQAYGHTLLRVLEFATAPVSAPGVLGIFEGEGQMRRRVEQIIRYIPNHEWSRIAFVLTVVVALLGLTDAEKSAGLVIDTGLPRPNTSQPVSAISQDGAISFASYHWQAWKTLFEVKGNQIQSLPSAREGFNYGHGGAGRGPTLMLGIGQAKLKDYRAEFEYCVTGVDPSFNPYSLPANYHDGAIFFHVADAKEDWNQCGSSEYVLGIQGNGDWSLRAIYNDYCAGKIGWDNPRRDAERWLARGDGLHIDRVHGNKYVIKVKGQRIQISVDGEALVDLVDDKMTESFAGQTLDHGGIGFHWGLDAMGWMRNFSMKRL